MEKYRNTCCSVGIYIHTLLIHFTVLFYFCAFNTLQFTSFSVLTSFFVVFCEHVDLNLCICCFVMKLSVSLAFSLDPPRVDQYFRSPHTCIYYIGCVTCFFYETRLFQWEYESEVRNYNSKAAFIWAKPTSRSQLIKLQTWQNSNDSIWRKMTW